ACNIATACRELSEEAAGIVDRRVADIVDTLSPLRLHNIVKAALWEADPVTARAQAEEKARERGVWAGRTDDHGTTTLFIKAPTCTVIRIEATINQIANTLAALGDTTSLNERRVRALDIIADPALAAELLQVARHLTTTPSAPEPPIDSEAATEREAPTAPTSPATPASPTTATEPAPPAEPDAATVAPSADAASAAPSTSDAPAPEETPVDPHPGRWPWDDVPDA
ncbi:hypothetical protein G3I17_39220, partial [Streptomyces sp. SID13031]|nr:hypothetical protein [Streptomyces sp. SID13031]